MVVLAMLLMSALALISSIQSAKASGTIYIRADGSVDPSTPLITTVDNVTYTLTGNIIDSIVVERNNITVDGNTHTVQGSGGGYGFNLTAVSNVTIRNAKVSGFSYGLYLHYSNYTSVLENNITNCSNYGICIEGDLFGEPPSKGNSIIRNNITQNYHGIEMWFGTDSNNVAENSVTENNGIGIIVSGRGNVVTGNNVTHNGGNGILLDSCSDARLWNNRMNNNSYNFGVQMTGYPRDLQNYVGSSNLVDGKPIYYWKDEHDRAVPLDAGCVILFYCRNITIENLTLERNRVGIIMGDVRNSTIAWNNIANNGASGIWLIESSGNQFYENNLVENYAGVWFNWAEGNHFYHNNFVLNTHYQTYSQNWKNLWDDGYPSGGNYWKPNLRTVDSNNGLYQNDTGADGIGDTPYVIDANNTDEYPLMKPYAGAHDIGITVLDASKTVIGQGYCLDVDFKVINYGEEPENFNTTLLANSTTIETQAVTLLIRNSTSMACIWNTTSCPLGNYATTVCVGPVPNETYTTDNNMTVLVIVTIPGDLNGNYKVSLQDLVILANAYNSKPGDSKWNPNADIEGNRIVDQSDVSILSQHYGQYYP
jgi:parallel beta-helix repeat protein